MSHEVRGDGLSAEDVALLHALAVALSTQWVGVSTATRMRYAPTSEALEEQAMDAARRGDAVAAALHAEAKRRGLIEEAER